ncbi:hypothetical protein PQG67_09790 [Corynebacterium pseudodiphtheriticum]|uniref:hypothetical protein n=1 Tax=Corynebacterium pseudodiphtheriticum TaxID=37637 RepID=UPI00234DA49C|nr:hypothetical protein [Corynebacterium pseudodiphtheriticum]MDC7069130.1 hypothetical protein [Corynebacterium pseudodiphtheriticum]MDC7085196.1 hypothetical protein [Corynebacterium pseudodiphtheriticum]MDC7087230.1 hypothetical protein [Corynebacterium pseudodiphtheriticum]
MPSPIDRVASAKAAYEQAESALSSARDNYYRSIDAAVNAGVSKMELHRQTGLSRAMLYRIINRSE